MAQGCIARKQIRTAYELCSTHYAVTVNDGAEFVAGKNLLTQLLNDGIYYAVAGLTYIEIYTAYGTSSVYVPQPSDYKQKNIIVTSRQKVLIDEKRIEVSFSEDS